MSQTVQSVEAYARGVVLSANPTSTERMQKQRTVIDRYRREYPNMEVSEVFANLSRINPSLFSDGVQADQSAAVVPRLMKLPGAGDSQNEAAAERSALQALIALHTKRYATASWNQMFEDLGKKYPDLFNDPVLIGPAGDI